MPTTPESADRTADAPTQDEVRGSRVVAKVMDDLITIPGTNIGIGLDVLIGLIPGIGDGASSALSGYILIQAVREGVSWTVLGRMILNLGIDFLLGLIPGVGDIADAAHRANRKNMRLLDATVADPDRERRTSKLYLIAAGAVVFITVALLFVAAGFALWLLWQLLTGAFS